MSRRAALPRRRRQIVLDDDTHTRILDRRTPACSLVEHDDPLPVFVGLGEEAPDAVVEVRASGGWG